MIRIGQYNVLKIDRETSVGLFLTDETGEEVLLPNKYVPAEFEIGETMEVFVYLDHEERKIATNLTPYILVGEFGWLQVAEVTEIGAFLDWGMEKQLLVPFGEQRERMQTGHWYVVYCDLDQKSGRLYASSRLSRFLNRDLSGAEVGKKVKILIAGETELGYFVIVENTWRGMIYRNEIFRKISIGEQTLGYIKHLREDGKLDISLQPSGFRNSFDENTNTILSKLELNNGFLPYHDKTPPEVIYREFAMSKKAFKAALGNLYKSGLIQLTEKGVRQKTDATE